MALIDDYLTHLGVTPHGPTHDTLVRLHRAHAERVPWQTLQVHLREPSTIEVEEAVRRIVARGGGWCFQLNGALAWLLSELGFLVTLHRAGVQMRDKPAKIDDMHVGIRVHNVPSDDGRPPRDWIADVGCGDLLWEPVPAEHGTYDNGGLRITVAPSVVAPGGWRLEHDPCGSFVAMDFAPEPTPLAHFAAKHVELCGPTSPWIATAAVERRHAAGIDRLVGRVLTRTDGTGTTETAYDDKDAWFGVLRDIFAWDDAAIGQGERDELWLTVSAHHATWLAERAALPHPSG